MRPTDKELARLLRAGTYTSWQLGARALEAANEIEATPLDAELRELRRYVRSADRTLKSLRHQLESFGYYTPERLTGVREAVDAPPAPQDAHTTGGHDSD